MEIVVLLRPLSKTTLDLHTGRFYGDFVLSKSVILLVVVAIDNDRLVLLFVLPKFSISSKSLRFFFPQDDFQISPTMVGRGVAGTFQVFFEMWSKWQDARKLMLA